MIKEVEIDLPYNFKPRWYQAPVSNALSKGFKRGICVWHRRCVAASTNILMADGTWKRIENIKDGDVVLSYNNKNNIFERDIVVHVWETGEKECITTNDSLITTEDHVVLSTSWKKIKDSRFIKCINTFIGGDIKNKELAEFLGLMLTDGSITKHQTPKFTNTEKELIDRIQHLVGIIFPDVVCKSYKKGNGEDITFSSCNGKSRKAGHFLHKYFSDSNSMPDIVWKFDKESVLSFLSGVMAGDGCISIKYSKTPRGFMSISATLIIEAGINKFLAEDYQKLLWKFGVKSIIKKDVRSRNYRVFVYSTQSIKRLIGLNIPIKRKQKLFDEVFNNSKEKKEKHTRVETIKRRVVSGIYNTFDLETEKNHNYIANGYIVHNSGKDKTFLNIMIPKMHERIGIYYYFFPTYNQGRKILWDGMDKTGFKFMDHFPDDVVAKTNNSDMKKELKCGSIFQVIGTDKIDAVVGTNPIGCVFSEYSLQDPKAWDYIRPILSENGGWALFNGTPRGHNHMYKMLQMAKKNDEWFWEVLTVDDTNAVSEADIQFERDSGMSDDLIDQEFYCSFDAAAIGAYYAKELSRVRREGRICNVPLERSVPVDAFFDLGMDDSTSIWLTQAIRSELRILKFMTDSGYDIDYYINQIKDWRDDVGAVLGKIILPHDGANRSLVLGISPLEYVRKHLKMESEVVVRPARKYDGIKTCRKIFPRCWFDYKGCIEGIDMLAQYRSEFHEDRGVQDTIPVHDVNSHAADAFQTFSLYNIRKIEIVPQAPKGVIDPKNIIPVTLGSHNGGGSWMF